MIKKKYKILNLFAYNLIVLLAFAILIFVTIPFESMVSARFYTFSLYPLAVVIMALYVRPNLEISKWNEKMFYNFYYFAFIPGHILMFIFLIYNAIIKYNVIVK